VKYELPENQSTLRFPFAFDIIGRCFAQKIRHYRTFRIRAFGTHQISKDCTIGESNLVSAHQEIRESCKIFPVIQTKPKESANELIVLVNRSLFLASTWKSCVTNHALVTEQVTSVSTRDFASESRSQAMKLAFAKTTFWWRVCTAGRHVKNWAMKGNDPRVLNSAKKSGIEPSTIKTRSSDLSQFSDIS
jgi:hypothetical protein